MSDTQVFADAGRERQLYNEANPLTDHLIDALHQVHKCVICGNEGKMTDQERSQMARIYRNWPNLHLGNGEMRLPAVIVYTCPYCREAEKPNLGQV